MSNSNAAADLTAHVDLSNAIRAAWTSALRMTGCIGCARLEIEQRLAGEAAAAEQRVGGLQPGPTRHEEGVSRMCRACLGTADS